MTTGRDNTSNVSCAVCASSFGAFFVFTFLILSSSAWIVMEPVATSHALVKGHRIAYGVFGSGEPVVLLHGTPSSSLIFRDLIAPLTEAGFKIHLFDLLGFGLSERPWSKDADTSMSGQVPILQELMKLWGLESTHLVAHDIGGGIAQRFTIFHPERVRTLTMIDVVSFDSYPSARTKEQMARGLESLMKTPDNDHREHFKEWLLSAVHNKHRFAESSLATLLEYISGPVGQPSLFEHQVRHYDPVHTMQVADRYHELGSRPIKLIWGKEDAWQNEGWANKLHEAIPGSELDVLEDAGHFSLEDQSEQIAELIIQFLRKHIGRI